MSDVKLYLGDCLEIMPTLEDESVDAVVTDPPYGVDASTGWSDDLYGDVAKRWNGGSIKNDKDTIMRDFIIAWIIEREIPASVFGSPRINKPHGYRGILVWDKGGGVGMGDLSFPWKPNWDEIYIYGSGWKGKRDSSVLRSNSLPRISMGRQHPHEKPTSLIIQIIKKLPKECTILDPFMGSGTTGVACVQTGRDFIGVEINSEYFEIAETRIKEAQLQLRMPF